MKQLLKHPVTLLIGTLFFAYSCTSEDRDTPSDPPPPSGDYANGIFVLNEGNFGSVNASVTFLDENNQVFNSIYSNVNNSNLGDTAQSMGLHGNNAYIVVNNSATVEVVDRYSFEHITTITDMMVNPRYVAFSDTKGFISNWGDPNNVNDDYIAILNLETHLIEGTIPVIEGPEKLIIHNNKLYVAHKGGYGYGNTISVIDIPSESLVSSITVGDVPSSMVVHNGSLYVTCSGKLPFTQNETLGKLHKINTNNETIDATLTFPEGVHPGFLEQHSNTLYYVVDGAVYNIHTSNFQLPTSPVFEPSNNGVQILYGFKVHNGSIYIADAKDYVSNGEVFIYNLEGILQDQFTAAIIPNSFYFNNNQ